MVRHYTIAVLNGLDTVLNGRNRIIPVPVTVPSYNRKTDPLQSRILISIPSEW